MLVASHDQGFVQALADEMDIQVAILTDTLNESGFWKILCKQLMVV